MLLERKLFGAVRKYINSKEAIVITGMRRVGKTSLLRYIYDWLPTDNKIFLDLENPLNRRYFEEKNYDKIKNSLEFLGLKVTGQKAYVFLDEIHLMPELPSVLKYLIDHYGIKFFLTGSASFYLKNLFSESLAGRKYIFELYPLDFEEFLIFKNKKPQIPSISSKITSGIYETILPLYEEYIRWGGFPEIPLKKTIEDKKRALDDIFTSYFQLEVIRMRDFRKNDVIRDLILLLMSRVSSKLDISKLSSELGVSRITLTEYISYLEGTYFLKLISPFARNKDSEIRKMPKVYFCDVGLINHYSTVDKGCLFEQSIFQNLRMKGEVNYYQKKNGAEIDFILDKKMAYEVKMNPALNDLNRLKKTCAMLNLKSYTLISYNFNLTLAKTGKMMYGFQI